MFLTCDMATKPMFDIIFFVAAFFVAFAILYQWLYFLYGLYVAKAWCNLISLVRSPKPQRTASQIERNVDFGTFLKWSNGRLHFIQIPFYNTQCSNKKYFQIGAMNVRKRSFGSLNSVRTTAAGANKYIFLWMCKRAHFYVSCSLNIRNKCENSSLSIFYSCGDRGKWTHRAKRGQIHVR